ncbi:unnamed protein product, partial [Polarella glacialis]
ESCKQVQRETSASFPAVWESSRAVGRSTTPNAWDRLYSVASVPAASLASLPPSRQPSFIEGGDRAPVFDWTASGQSLCPSLVVPDGMEFVFAVREVLTSARKQLSFSVVDLSGQPLSHVIINEFGSKCGIHLQMLDSTPLSWVRTSDLFDRPRGCPTICRASGEVFGTLVKEGSAQGGTYFIRGKSGQRLLSFEGNFREKKVDVIDCSGQLVGACERCAMDFDASPHYQVRVAPQTDAGLVLCGLLAIEKMQGES